MQASVTLPISADHFRKLVDPIDPKRSVYHCYVQVRHLASAISLGPNPRAHEVDSRIGRVIRESLEENVGLFHLLNRGITISAREVEYDNRSGQLRLRLPEEALHGILDGGNTYKVIENAKREKGHESPEPAYLDSYVKLEIMTNIDDDIVLLAEARNTSAQVKTFSLANLAGRFDWIKETLKAEPFAENIAYREGEDKAINAVDLICLMTLFHPKYGGNEHPVKAYTSKNSCLEDYRVEFDDEGNPKKAGYYKLRPVLVDILKLYDHVHETCLDHYRKVGGISKVRKEEGEEKNKVARPGALKELGGPRELFFKGGKVKHSWPIGYLYPMLGSLRALLDSTGKQARWLVDPFAFFTKCGEVLVGATLERSSELGRNPNAVGKSKGHWQQLFNTVKLRMLEEQISKQSANA